MFSLSLCHKFHIRYCLRIKASILRAYHIEMKYKHNTLIVVVKHFGRSWLQGYLL